MIAISLVPIIAAGVASVILGWIWFHPKLFGTAYMAGMTPEMQAQGKKRMPISVICTLLASMLVAWVMAFVGNALNEFVDVIGAIELGVWLWLGFIAPSMLGSVLWEQKSFKLYLINSLYWLVNLIVIAIVLLFGGQYFSGSAAPYNSDSTGGAVQVSE
jgi:hypothetical protein